ncbi:MAG TPA: hypothetical protein DIT39_00450 [Tissierellales bacterium]|nr:hypothetical protein [Tissierellales bacterium]
MAKRNPRFSFARGYARIPAGDQLAFRTELLEKLGYNNLASFYDRKNGKKEPKVSEKEIIEELFVKYGVKKSEIWGLA